MNLALIEMRRAKLRFGLLTGAVSLLLFLIVFLSSISTSLLRSITGALDSLPADGIVYAVGANGTLQASRLPGATVDAVAKVDGVAAAAPLRVLDVNARLAGAPAAEAFELQVFGVDAGSAAAPEGLSGGRFPRAAGEIAIDVQGSTQPTIAIGDRVTLAGLPEPQVVVGTYSGTQFGTPTAWTSSANLQAMIRTLNPAFAGPAPVNAVAFSVDRGADAQQVAADISATVPGADAATVDQAIADIPGSASISQTFGLLVGLTFVIGVVVIGFFFLILTVGKLKVFTLLRATGAPTSRLGGAVALQVATVVLLAGAIAVGGSIGALSGLGVVLDPLSTAAAVFGVLAASLAAAMVSVRRISALDPAAATGAR